jgi:hypothetical protein
MEKITETEATFPNTRLRPLMSQRHIKKKGNPPPINWWQIALVAAVLLVAFAALFTFANWVHSSSLTGAKASGKILEIRKVVIGLPESQFGGRIRYGVEVHVQYMANGHAQDRWLRASDDMYSDEFEMKLASHPTECTVYWPPNHPENAKCSLR